MTEPLQDGGCKWISTYEHAILTQSLRRPEAAEITCCGCKARVPYLNSFVTMAVGKHGNRLPLPVFTHCESCSLILDPRQAWMVAYHKDPAAALPDPEKVKAEEELNRSVNPIYNPDLQR